MVEQSLEMNGYIGRDVESQAIVTEQCTFQGGDRAPGLLARAQFQESIAGRFSTVFVSDDIGARYDVIGSK